MAHIKCFWSIQLAIKERDWECDRNIVCVHGLDLSWFISPYHMCKKQNKSHFFLCYFPLPFMTYILPAIKSALGFPILFCSILFDDNIFIVVFACLMPWSRTNPLIFKRWQKKIWEERDRGSRRKRVAKRVRVNVSQDESKKNNRK